MTKKYQKIGIVISILAICLIYIAFISVIGKVGYKVSGYAAETEPFIDFRGPDISFAKNLKEIGLLSLLLSGMFVLIATERKKAAEELSIEKKSKETDSPIFSKLLDYVKRELEDGTPKDKLKTKLLYEGWNEYLLKKAFTRAAVNIKEKKSGIEKLLG